MLSPGVHKRAHKLPKEADIHEHNDIIEALQCSKQYLGWREKLGETRQEKLCRIRTFHWHWGLDDNGVGSRKGIPGPGSNVCEGTYE